MMPRMMSAATHRKMIRSAPMPPPMALAESQAFWLSVPQSPLLLATLIMPPISQTANRMLMARMIHVNTRTLRLGLGGWATALGIGCCGHSGCWYGLGLVMLLSFLDW